MHKGDIFVLLILLLLCGGSLIGIGRRAMAAHRGQPGVKAGKRGGWLEHRRKMRMEKLKHKHASIRAEARHRQRLREREQAAQARARGGRDDDDDEGAAPRKPWRRPWRTVPSRVVRLGDECEPGAEGGSSAPNDGPSWPPPPDGDPRRPAPAPPAFGPRPPAWDTEGGRPEWPAQPAPATSPQQPPVRNGTAPAATTPAPGPTESPTLEGVVMTAMPDHPGALTVPGVEQIIEGANALRRYMLSGNARAKQRGILGIEAAEDALAGTVRALARDMAEPGQHYGHEITEPLAMSATHLTAASLSLSEIEGRIGAIVRASEELAAAGVQAPHHSEFAEGERLAPGGGGTWAPGSRGASAGTAPPRSYVDSPAIRHR